ncbi:DUF6530 family protein [Flavobacterium sp.]|uniref:DUF6530 family protein n=1 Tax=Flavobacterium sp. TaxID=239 RepID=UPI002630ACC3|nr:DUF6530 family protein [Flavobacterium sp.]
MKVPKHLSHKPIISVNDYDKIDAQYANKSDAKALSIGQAQYDKDEISLKIWRHTGEKWSRESEEMPLHRSIDLNILLIGALLTDVDANYAMTSFREEIIEPSRVKEIQDYYKSHEKFLRPRLAELKSMLDNFFDKEKI